jgi:hypothetical protein
MDFGYLQEKHHPDSEQLGFPCQFDVPLARTRQAFNRE